MKLHFVHSSGDSFIAVFVGPNPKSGSHPGVRSVDQHDLDSDDASYWRGYDHG